MKKSLLFVLALAVIPVGVDAQGTPSASCAYLTSTSPLEDVRPCAEQGDASAQFYLGFMYVDGRGVPEDDVEAVRWWRLAAEQGYASGQSILGIMYMRGEGVPYDLVLAYMWLNLSVAQGIERGGADDPAQVGKDRIEPLMTREQIDEAQRLSREWLAAHPPGGN